MTAPAPTAEFFVSGGTVPLESRSYVERSADAGLLDALTGAKFCYVLNSRQMGKSSLCVRTMSRLQANGVRSAFVDLTKIGGRNVTPDQWYAGLVVEIGRALGLRAEMLRYWQEERDISPMQRFFSSLRDVALEKIATPIVIFIDEIDATRSLPFSPNEFFAGIRECHNRRVHDAEYKRLTFCLLGVAVPTDLISDPTTTPFNVGERIVLLDFTEAEASVLTEGLGPGGKEVLSRILYWTHGHPFLTQSLAATSVQRGDIHSAADVDRLAEELLFQAKARETNINLADVGNRILNGYPDPDQIAKYRADVLSVYENVVKGRDVFDDESNHLIKVLKLSGIVRVEERKLKVRNRIYERVFDRGWIRENMPGAELRRQRRAFIRGALRTAAVAVIVIASITALAVKNARLAEEARRERDRANYEVYVATMNLMRPTWDQHNIGRLRELLESMRNNPARGWEWDYWNRMAHLEVGEFPKHLPTAEGGLFSPNGKIYLNVEGKLVEYSPDTNQSIEIIPSMNGSTGEVLYPFADGKRLLEFNFGKLEARLLDLSSRRETARFEDFAVFGPQVTANDGKWVIGWRPSDFQPDSRLFKSPVMWDTQTGKPTSIPTQPIRAPALCVSPDGKMLAAAEQKSAGAPDVRVVVREFGTWKILSTFETVEPTQLLHFSSRGDVLAASTTKGSVYTLDPRSGRELAHLQLGDAPAVFMQFSTDDSWLAVGAANRIGHLYDVSGKGLKEIATFPDAVFVSISPDKSRIATIYFSNYFTMRFYDPATYREMDVARSSLGPVADTQVVSTRAIARARAGNSLIELNPATGQTKPINVPGKVISLPLSGESHGVIQQTDGTVAIFNFETNQSVMTLPKGTPVPGSAIDVGRDRVALFFVDKRLQVWDIVDKRLVKEIAMPFLGTASASDKDGKQLAVSFNDNSLSVWNTSTWAETRLPRVGNVVLGITFSRDGSRLLAATSNDNTEVWELRPAKLVGHLMGHSQGVLDAAFSPDEKRIVTASGDQTVRVWDVSTLRELTILAGHHRGVLSARFTDDGKSIVSIDDLGDTILWQTKK